MSPPATSPGSAKKDAHLWEVTLYGKASGRPSQEDSVGPMEWDKRGTTGTLETVLG